MLPLCRFGWKLASSLFFTLCIVKLQRIYYLLVEHFQLGHLTWKEDVRGYWYKSETPYQLVELYVPWKNRNNQVSVNRAYYPT